MRAKLTPEQVKEIRSRYGTAALHLQRAKEAFDSQVLAERFGVAKWTILRVAHHDSYDADGNPKEPH